MKQNLGVMLFLQLLMVLLFSATVFAASSYDRELIVQDKTRAMQVEKVFKEMMAAYEDEDARGFLDYVSDERFRQDYITFTDALYSDFRNYEIHQVDYWIDKVVSDNVKQFLFVHWEKRYENLDDGRQLTQKGVSRFLFDEVDGDYLLVELAGNHLWGASLQEWREEVPQISGQEATVAQDEGAICDGQHLSLCDGANCSSNGGYWYDGSCHQTPYSPAAVCDEQHLELCDATNCDYPGPGYWYDNTCNASPQALPDLVIFDLNVNVSMVEVSIRNDGAATISNCTVHWTNGTPPYDATANVPSLSAGESQNVIINGLTDMESDGGTVTVDYYNEVPESNESNNVATYQ